MFARLLKRWLIVAGGSVFCYPVVGQNKLDSLYHLEEVVITAKVRQEVIPVQSLSGAELKKLNAHSVADAVRYFSGAQVKDYGGIGGLKTVNIRSMGTNHVGVFYDGIELGNAQNGVVDLGRFSLENMEAVTLYNGQKSAIFQPAKDFGSAGSIYLQSRTPLFESGKKHNVSATFKTGSFGAVNPSLLWEQKVNNSLSASLSAEYMYTTGRYKFTYAREGGYDTTAVRKNGDVNALRAEGGVYGKIKDGYWRAKAYFYYSERGYPGAVVGGDFEHEDRQWDANTFVQGTWAKDFSPHYSLLVNGKFAYDYLHYLADPRKDESVMYVENYYYQKEAYLSAANKFMLTPFWDASLSVDYQWNGLNANLKDFPYPRRNTTLTSAATSLHFDRFKLQASLLGTFVHENVASDTTASQSRAEWTPAVFASWQPVRKVDFNVRAFYKRIFRMPTLNDLYYTFIGNIKLKPEYTNQYNIGFTYQKNLKDGWLRSLQLQADAYYNEVENKIVAMPTNNFYRWTMINLGKVEIKGVDVVVMGNWQFGADWALNSRFSYTYQKAQDFTDPTDEDSYGGQIPYVPWHSGSVILNGSYKSWELNYSFIYTGERYNSTANLADNDSYVLPWYTSDLSLAKSLTLNKLPLKVTLEVNNLFNQQYEVVRNYPMPGTHFKLILNIKI